MCEINQDFLEFASDPREGGGTRGKSCQMNKPMSQFGVREQTGFNADSIALVEGIFPYRWTTLLRFHVGLSQHVCGRGFHFWELVPASVECLVCWLKTGRTEVNDEDGWAQRSWPFDLCFLRLRLPALFLYSSRLGMNSIGAATSRVLWTEQVLYMQSNVEGYHIQWLLDHFLSASRCQFDFFCDLLLICGETYRGRDED